MFRAGAAAGADVTAGAPNIFDAVVVAALLVLNENGVTAAFVLPNVGCAVGNALGLLLIPNPNVGFCVDDALLDSCVTLVAGLDAMVLKVLFTLCGCPNTNGVFEVVVVAGNFVRILLSACSVFGRFCALFNVSSVAGFATSCPNEYVGFGVSVGPFVAGLTKTFSKTVIPLSLLAFEDAPVSVSSFDTSFDPNIGAFVVFDPNVVAFVVGDPNANLKPAKVAD